MAEARIIYNPGKMVMNMFYRKMNQESRKELADKKFDAVGLFQTTVSGVLYYADRAAKTSNVYPVEINGSCPQHITTLAFFGETSAVETAMKMVIQEEKERKNQLI
ncbi:MAG: BMC domain-containing protein [Eubacteriales bacterium]|nr:BMC domain-containing protein [Eubacteriales bacterium]